jgi:hypothetical protein
MPALFTETFPHSIRRRTTTYIVDRHRMWMTAIIYVLLSLFYSNEQVQRQKEVFRKYRSLRARGFVVKKERTRDYELEVARVMEDVPPSMVKMEKYLVEYNVPLVEVLPAVGLFINKIF